VGVGGFYINKTSVNNKNKKLFKKHIYYNKRIQKEGACEKE